MRELLSKEITEKENKSRFTDKTALTPLSIIGQHKWVSGGH
jgi:hypothetical protein